MDEKSEKKTCDVLVLKDFLWQPCGGEVVEDGLCRKHADRVREQDAEMAADEANAE